MDILFKLNFEKTAIFVLVLILLISTASIYTQFISLLINQNDKNEISVSMNTNISFPAVLLKADELYKQGELKKAQNEYLLLTKLGGLSQQQKAIAYFKLGVCNFHLGKYELAKASFLSSVEYNSDDSVAYNNAAVSSYYMKDYESAESLQKKAISKRPVVEYYYNLGSIYETPGRYTEAVKYYSAVTKVEENITKDDRIDPVRIKNKIMKLSLNKDYQDTSKDLMIALKLKDAREVFVIDDADMDIKGDKFEWHVEKVNGISKLYCTYDKEKLDPYNLIDSLEWTVKSGGKIVYTSRKDSFTYRIFENNGYVVSLDITYNGKMHAGSYVNIYENNAFVRNTYSNVLDEKAKYYEYAVYEQVFEKNFRISTKGYVDRFNTQWGKDNVEVRVMDKDFIDAQSALYINNNSKTDAGIWADLESLINDKQLKGKTIGIKFYARKITGNAELDTTLRVKSGKQYKNTYRSYDLDYKWKRFGFDVFIPENADGLTISFKTKPGEEVKLDGFIINIVR